MKRNVVFASAPWSSILFLVAITLVGCHSYNHEAGEIGTTMEEKDMQVIDVDRAEAAKRAIGQRVRIEGTARNAKLSAAVVSDLVVYCLDRESWAADVAGKKVTIQGMIEYTREFQARVSPEGEIGAGTNDAVFVLRTCEYSVPKS